MIDIYSGRSGRLLWHGFAAGDAATGNAPDAAGAQPVSLEIDLRPDLPQQRIMRRLACPRTKKSRANYLRKSLGLSPLETTSCARPPRRPTASNPSP